ncbi:MAG: hypothetical protein SGPRY_007433 [Prymnesium sp.]
MDLSVEEVEEEEGEDEEEGDARRMERVLTGPMRRGKWMLRPHRPTRADLHVFVSSRILYHQYEANGRS